MKLLNVMAAVRRSWQAHSPSELWLGAGMPGPSRPDPDDDPLAMAVKYLSEKFGIEATKFDLAEIMAKAINAAAGVPAAEDLGASVYINPARRDAVNPLFRPQMVEEFRRAIGEAASAVMSENYSIAAQEPPELGQGSTAPSASPEPAGPLADAAADLLEEVKGEPEEMSSPDGPALVDADAAAWQKAGVTSPSEMIDALIKRGVILIRQPDESLVSFGNREEAEAELGVELASLPQFTARGFAAPDPVTTAPSPEGLATQAPSSKPPRAETPDPLSGRPGLIAKVQEARPLVQELLSISRSIGEKTGYDLDVWTASHAAARLGEILAARTAAAPGHREYQPAAHDRNIGRLVELLDDILEHRAAIEAAGFDTHQLSDLRHDLTEFFYRHSGRASSCDVSRIRHSMEDRMCGSAESIASDVLGCSSCPVRKLAIQLSKGNLVATKDGRITIDPGFNNCPVVRRVIQNMDTKSSDLAALREKLDDMGMIVTQGSHGQVNVYCLVRTEGEGGAQTRLCQWFIDAHGNDGKFKIECAKD